MATSLQRPKSDSRLWLLFAAVVIALISLAAFRWWLSQPYAIHSDESFYINEAQIDVHILHAVGLHQAARWILHTDGLRPPAYRLLVLPFLFLFGYHTLIVRLVTFACYL